MRIILCLFCLILLSAPSSISVNILAQDDTTCPTIVDDAVTLMGNACLETGRNQACYGNLQMAATPRPSVTDFIFEHTGDIVDVVDIESLELDPLDLDTATWGIALMKLQASLPDTLPGQNVTVLLFGDVVIENAVDDPTPTITASTGGGPNLHSGPGTNYPVVGGLPAGDSIIADGRTADNSWLRVQLDAGAIGWVFAGLVTTSEDIESLEIRDADDVTMAYTPMQAFYFQSGVGETACAQAPNGMLIQTPQGAGEVVLSINEITVSMGSTVFFQTIEVRHTLVISTIEGRAEVTAEEQTQTVLAGEQVSVPLDNNLAASAPPGEPEPFESIDFQALPYQPLPDPVQLPEGVGSPTPVTTAAPATPEQKKKPLKKPDPIVSR